MRRKETSRLLKTLMYETLLPIDHFDFPDFFFSRLTVAIKLTKSPRKE